jgi:lipoprotein-anchoring transpeptidase ErfK/SrfK
MMAKMNHDSSVAARRLGVWCLFAISVSLIGCRNAPSSPAQISGSANNAPAASRTTPAPSSTATPQTSVSYHAVPIEGARSLAQLKAELGDEGMMLVLKINRVDLKHIKQGEALIVPDNASDPMAVAPFPLEIESARSIPKLLFVSRRAQVFGAYELGQLARWGPTSTGKKATPTPAGLYHTNWKSKQAISTVNDEWVLPWYFNLDNFEGISLHQYDLPGYPASHACVRLLEEDATWIYNWADQWILSPDGHKRLAYGTPVVIFGDYGYGKPPPWKQLLDNPHAASISASEAEEALRAHWSVIQERVQARAAVIEARAHPPLP